MRRRISRAPELLPALLSARSSAAAGVQLSSQPSALARLSSSSSCSRAICLSCSMPWRRKAITPSSLPRSSGEKSFFAALSAADLSCARLLSLCSPKPIVLLSSSAMPALEVIISITSEKGIRLPEESVSEPSSVICSSSSKILRSAFSISSSSTTQAGLRLTCSVSRPPLSNPTYPGGAPISFETLCRSEYSDISKRISASRLWNSAAASAPARRLLPTPLVPMNRKLPTGRRSSCRPERQRRTESQSRSIASS